MLALERIISLLMKMNVKARMAAVITTVTITSAAITALVVSDTNFSLMASHAISSATTRSFSLEEEK